MNDCKRKQFWWNKSRGANSVSGALLISLCFCSQSMSLPFGKSKDTDKEDGALVAVPKIKLSKEQQNEFDMSLKNGNAYLKASNFELALICYMRCSTLNPSNSDAHLGLASCYVGLRKTEQAQSAIFESLRCDPAKVESRFLLGRIMMADQRWDEAGGQYLQVLKQQPENLGARGNLATCLQMMGQIDAAIGQYKYILVKEPKVSQAAYNLGAAYELKNMYDDAAVYYKKVVELEPNNSNAYSSLAKCLIAKKDYKAAQILLSHSATISPNSYFVHLMQGYLNEVEGDKRGAIEEYTKAVALAPQDPDSWRSLQRMIESGSASRIGSARGMGGSKIGSLRVNTN